MLSGRDYTRAMGVNYAVGPEMEQAQREWEGLFRGEAEYLEAGAGGMGIAGGVAAEIARLVTVELESGLEGGAALQAGYKQALERLRVQVELAAASGGLMMKPYVVGERVAVDFVRGGRFYPTAVDSRGEMTGVLFVERRREGKRWYTRLEHHELTDEGYVIQNRAFAGASAAALGAPAGLDALPAWRGLCPRLVLTTAEGRPPEYPLFAYFRMPFANHVEEDSPLGVAVFSRATEFIRQADMQYQRILWEYEGSELAVDATAGALKPLGVRRLFGDGERPRLRLPKRRERLFRELTLNRGDSGDLYAVYSPPIRDESLFNGLNRLLKRIEFACYLSYGTLSEPALVEKTAEEVRMSRQRSFSAVCDIQRGLEAALRRLVWAMDACGRVYGLVGENEPEAEATFRWGDSITQDTEKERETMRRDCRDGAARWWEYRMRFYGESEEEAKKALAKEEEGK